MKGNNMHSDGKMDVRSVLQNGGKKKDLCISVLPSYCYVALDKSFPSLILVFLIWKIGKYEPSHPMS